MEVGQAVGALQSQPEQLMYWLYISRRLLKWQGNAMLLSILDWVPNVIFELERNCKNDKIGANNFCHRAWGMSEKDTENLHVYAMTQAGSRPHHAFYTNGCWVHISHPSYSDSCRSYHNALIINFSLLASYVYKCIHGNTFRWWPCTGNQVSSGCSPD